MPKIDVAFAVDRGNLDHVAVVVRSILAHAKPSTDVHFHILFDGDTHEAQQAVSAWNFPASLSVLGLSNPYAGAAPGGRLTSATYLRLQIPEALWHLDRVIYLDADVAVHRDLAELYSVDLGEAVVGGVLDLVFYSRLGREMAAGQPQLADYVVSLGLDSEVPRYINAGVLVLDLRRLRAMNFAEVARAAFQSRQFEYGDQCLLNSVLADRIALLDPRWNATAQNHAHPSRWRFLPLALRQDAILQRSSYWLTHYTGPRKPWSSAAVWRGGAWWASALQTGLHWPKPGGSGGPDELKEANRLRLLGRVLAALWVARHGRGSEARR